MIIPVWSTEKEDKGYALVLKEQFIELTTYDIPVTSYSAGGMYSYAVQELDEKHKGKNPVLIRIDEKAGHGAGKPTGKVIEEQTDKWSFMFYNMVIEPYKNKKIKSTM